MSGVQAKVLVDYSKYKYLLQHCQDVATIDEGESDASGIEDIDPETNSFAQGGHSNMTDPKQAESMERVLHEDNTGIQEQQTALAEKSDLTPNLPPAPMSLADHSKGQTAKKAKKSGNSNASNAQWWKLGANSKKKKSRK